MKTRGVQPRKVLDMLCEIHKASPRMVLIAALRAYGEGLDRQERQAYLDEVEREIMDAVDIDAMLAVI